MRLDAAEADRLLAVRAAATGWKRAGAIEETTFRAIVSAYPDDRVRLGLGLRILAGLAAFVGAGAFAGLLGLVFRASDEIFAFGLAALFTAATEVQTGRLRRAQAGAEYATALLAAISAGVAWLSIVDDFRRGTVWAGCAVAFALAAWRWGYASFAALAGVWLLLACETGALGRLLWFGLGLVAIPIILWFARSQQRPPAHRRCFAAFGLVLLAGAYVAANVYALDHRWVDLLAEGPYIPADAGARRVAIAGTILVPPIVIALGLRFRDRKLLAAGVLFTAASLLTLRSYYPVGPWWLALIAAGAVCIALAVVLRRWLDAGPGRERFGFTAEAPFEDRRMVAAVQAAATIASMSPGPKSETEPPFTGGGGGSGGGGATGGT